MELKYLDMYLHGIMMQRHMIQPDGPRLLMHYDINCSASRLERESRKRITHVDDAFLQQSYRGPLDDWS